MNQRLEHINTVEEAREFLINMRYEIDDYEKRIEHALEVAAATSSAHELARLAKRRFAEFSKLQPITDLELIRLVNYWLPAIRNLEHAEYYLTNDSDHSQYHRKPGSNKVTVDMDAIEYMYDSR